jgi:probable F420-dependent oxidoreductase
MRFGFTLPNNWGVEDTAGMIDLARRAEHAGYDSVWVNHHLLNVGYVGDRLGAKPYHDALTTLTWAGAVTSRVRLGTSVLVIPYLSPFVLAKAMATLDQLSGGRVLCGVGVGSLPEEHQVVSTVPFDARGRYADEFLQVMVELWTSASPSFSGEFFSFEGAMASPAPLQRPHCPLLIGGNRPAALRRTARFGQGWHALGTSPEGLRQRLERLDHELEAVGRSRAEVTISVRADLDVLADGVSAEGRPHPFRGTAGELAQRVEQYAEVGVDEVVVSVASGDLDRQQQQLGAFADGVLSKLAGG